MVVDLNEAVFTRALDVPASVMDLVTTTDSIHRVIKRHNLNSKTFYREFYSVFGVTVSSFRHLAGGMFIPKKSREVRYLEVWLPTQTVTTDQRFDFSARLPSDHLEKIQGACRILGTRLAEVEVTTPTGKVYRESNIELDVKGTSKFYLESECITVSLDQGKIAIANLEPGTTTFFNEDDVQLSGWASGIDHCPTQAGFLVCVKIKIPYIAGETCQGVDGRWRSLEGPIWTFVEDLVSHPIQSVANKTVEDESSKEEVPDEYFVTVNPVSHNGGLSPLEPGFSVLVVMNNQFRFLAHMSAKNSDAPYKTVKELMMSKHGPWFKAQVREILERYVDGEMTLVFGFPLESIPPPNLQWRPSPRA
jgi:hypothetical protein